MNALSFQFSFGGIVVAVVVLIAAAGLLVWVFSGKGRRDD
jgi:hypothetical protein